MIYSPPEFLTPPAGAMPAACEAGGCRYKISPARGDDCYFEHHHDGNIDRFVMKAEWDVDKDIWGTEVKPWLEGLHQEPPA